MDASEVLENLLKLPLDSQPWWVYALMALVPICVLITIREFFCWFWKINKLISRLERIDKNLRNLKIGSDVAARPGAAAGGRRAVDAAERAKPEKPRPLPATTPLPASRPVVGINED